METAAPGGPLDAATRRVRRALDDASASLTRSRVLALCSGGADSVALVAVLASLPRGAAPATLDVLFLDHGLRDVGEERACAAAVAASVGAPFHELTAPAGLLAGGAGGLEAAAREWRHEAAAALAREHACDVVATGHTANDQLETALLSLVGATGHAGSAHAMPIARPLTAGIRLVRPLLPLSRREVEELCRHARLAWAEDPTNADPEAHRRNAVRHRVVPALLEVQPGAGAALVRAGGRAREQHEATAALADALLDAWGAADAVDVRRLASLDPSARREVLAAWLRRAGLGRGLTSRGVAAVDALATRPARAACARADLAGGACVRRDGYHLRIQPAPRHGGSRP